VIWRSPGGQAYLERVAGDLAQGKNAVLVVPRPHLAGRLTSALQDLLRQRGFPSFSQWRVPRDPQGGFSDLAGIIRNAASHGFAPAHAGALGNARGQDAGIGGPDGGHASADDGLHSLFDSFSPRGGLRFLALRGLETLPREAQESVAQGVSRWAAITQEALTSAGAHGGLRIVAPVPPVFPQMKSDLFMAVHAFWAAISRTDLDWAFNRLYNEHPSDDPADYLYLKAVCLAVCDEDFALMERIVSARPRTLRDAYAILQAHPLRRAAERRAGAGASATADAEPPAFNHGRPPRRPVVREEVELWSDGLLAAVGASRLHPAFLQYDGLERAVASAQRELFLPLVDYVHSLIVASVERAHGRGVWASLESDEEARNEILTEISPLAFFIKRKVAPKGGFGARQREYALECAFAWRRIRHSTAHNRMASLDLIRDAFGDYARFRKNVYEALAPRTAPELPDWYRNPPGAHAAA
jgi:hypothetical protein